MKKSNEEKRVIIYCRESRDDYGENYERIETQRDLLVKLSLSDRKLHLESSIHI